MTKTCRKCGVDASLPSRLKLTFSISDLDNPPDTSDLAVEDSPESTDTPDEPTFPVRASLNITKSGHPGALVMDLLVEDESFIIDNASFYPDRTLAEDLTAEGDWRRRGTYVGPRFDHLDEEVQSQFEQFLEEREVNANLGEPSSCRVFVARAQVLMVSLCRVAMFIPLYCEYKEQKVQRVAR